MDTTADAPLFLGTALTKPRDRRIALGLIAILIVMGAAMVPYAADPAPVIPVFVPSYNAMLVLLDALTALLLFAQYRELRARSLLVLACGYLYTTIVVSAHALSFKDAFVAGRLFGDMQTTAWLWIVWHGMFPFSVGAYAILASRERKRPGAPNATQTPAKTIHTARLAALATVLFAVCGIAGATQAERLLLPLMQGDLYIDGVTVPILSIAWFTTFIALGLLLWKTRTERVIDLWLAVALCAWVIDMALSALLVTGRYQVGFYVGRFYSLFATSVVLSLLLRETFGLYGRVVRALHAAQLHARQLEDAHVKLRAGEERYRSLFESIDEGFTLIEMIFDDGNRPLDYRFLEINPAFERHTGLTDAAGRTMRSLAPAHEQHWFDIYGEIALTGEPRRFQNRAEALGGRWFDVYAFRVGDPAQRRLAVLFTDITQRKQAEHALQEADRRKDEFLATLAHELRNPLAPIQNSVDILHIAGGAGATNTTTLQILRRQVRNVVRLVDDLLEVSRLSRGQMTLRTEPVDLADVVRSAIETSRPLIDAERHQLTVVLPRESLILEVDPLRLSQVIANLLNNAAKYTKPGGQIWLTVRPDGGSVVIAVRDNGIGMPAEMLSQVFELFVQIDRDHRRTHGGLGIGLTLVKSLVEMHGGTVEASSAGRDKGSEFIVRLPFYGAMRPSNGKNGGHAETAGRRRVLVVDDNADAANSLGVLLTEMGNDVQIVFDGSSALQALEMQRPEFVFLDIGMPGMSGYDVAERISKNPAYDEVTLVATTGWGQRDDRRRSRAAGFDHHLVKPLDVVAIEDLLAKGKTSRRHVREDA